MTRGSVTEARSDPYPHFHPLQLLQPLWRKALRPKRNCSSNFGWSSWDSGSTPWKKGAGAGGAVQIHPWGANGTNNGDPDGR